jgi:AcrR family transcriptional regulator
MSKRLGRQEWIDAGLETLAVQGVEAVRVERLAEKLDVTKGSFYWHFKDRRALLEALLEAWRTRTTSDIIERVETHGGNAQARLAGLFKIVGRADLGLDRSVRNWAAHDDAAQAALQNVDRRRIDYLQSLFIEIGFSSSAAKARARFAYHAMVGQMTMNDKVIEEENKENGNEKIIQMLVTMDK